MVKFDNSVSKDEGGELAYDLRQIYAKLVGEHLEDIAQARKQDNYFNYFKALKDLFIVVQHKFGEDGKEEFYKLMNDARKIANQYSAEWTGRSKESNSCAIIEEVLNKVEMLLYQEIDDANIFGKGWEYDPDEI